ncbi:MAG: DUF4058 family protein [bacterium]|nr:DUF4058 family protein [bacterium]
MPRRVQSIRNQYRGINAHLHSYWQQMGWNNFHNPHITYLLSALKRQLLPLGYTATIEESIQLRRAYETVRFPKADLTVYDLDPTRFGQATPSGAYTLSGVVVPMPTMMQRNPISEKPYRAIAVYPRETGVEREPVAWIELLSPSNKGRSSDGQDYLMKRYDLLDAGIVFVELDYLHETPSTLDGLADYTVSNNQTGAHPYRILVFLPHPSFENGDISLNEFDVDSPIPLVTLPLRGDDHLQVDFNVPYQRQFEELLYGLDVEGVDYVQLPLNFDRYSEADQTRIVRRMLAVLAAQAAGHDLESGPFPVEDISLEEGLRRLQALGTDLNPTQNNR